MAAMAPQLQTLCRQAPAQLGDDSVHRSEVGERSRGQCAIELAEGTRRRQVAGALDLGALELPPQQRLEAAQRLARQALVAGGLGGQGGLRPRAPARRPAGPPPAPPAPPPAPPPPPAGPA